MSNLLDRYCDHLSYDEREPAVAKTYEIDDGGLSTNDAAARFLREAGDVVTLSEDMLTRGKRSAQSRASTAVNEDFLSAAALNDGSAREDAIALTQYERALDYKFERERAYIARREWINMLCAPVVDKPARLRRLRSSLRMLARAKHYDFRAIVAACANADMLALAELSTERRINAIASRLPGEEPGETASHGTARRYIKTGNLLIQDLQRHAAPHLKPEGNRTAPSKCTVKPNIRKAVKGSLHDTALAVVALSKLSPRDQNAVTRAIEKHVLNAEHEAGEASDRRAGLKNLSCGTLDTLDFVGRNDTLTRRQLAKHDEPSRNRIVHEMVTDRLDALTGIQPDAGEVQQRADAYRSFAKSGRQAANLAKRKRTKAA